VLWCRTGAHKQPLYSPGPGYVGRQIKRLNAIENLRRTILDLADLSRRAGLHAYFFVHATKFLHPRGRFGFIVANSWLDVEYGRDCPHATETLPGLARDDSVLTCISRALSGLLQDCET